MSEEADYLTKFDKIEYLNEPLPLKDKNLLTILYECTRDPDSISAVIYEVTQREETATHFSMNSNLIEEKSFRFQEFRLINSSDKEELLKKKKQLEIDLLEKGYNMNCFMLKLPNGNSDSNIPTKKIPSFNYDMNLECKKVIRLDKQAFYETIIEQLLIYELNFYEEKMSNHSQTNHSQTKELDDITKEIICLTHYLNHKESIKQINCLKAQLYKKLSESIRNKNFSQIDELQK